MFAISLPTSEPGRQGQVYGIEVAVKTFTRAWCRYTKQEKLFVLPEHPWSMNVFLDLAAMEGIPPERCVQLAGENLRLIDQITTVFQPDPMILNIAWLRAIQKPPSFAICGLTHTMTGVSAANVVTSYVNYPTQQGDAIICPSQAIKDVMETHFRLSEEYHNHRFGLTGASAFHCPVETPVIPLGVDVEKFANRATPDKRKKQRETLGIKDDEVVILFFGRMSYFSKSHPLPLLLGVERAAQQLKGKQKIRLVMMGYFNPPEIEPSYHALIKDVCPSVQVDVVSKDDPRLEGDFWAGADIFTSLVDNYQESFGLTPIEGMAAGLPCVITDWDGYRDGVRHGVDGFQIPTVAPPPGTGMELAYRYFHSGNNYGEYLASTAQSVAIDIDLLAAAFAVLASDPEKRKQMGANGRKRAQQLYDWSVIIPQYEALWKSQAEKRRTFATPATPPGWKAVHSGYPDPYTVFKSFPTKHLTMEDRVSVACTPDDVERILKHDMNKFLPSVLMPIEKSIALLTWISTQPEGTTLQQAFEKVGPGTGPDKFFRTMGWMLKNAFVRLVK
ncbi:MAG: glycosyltransferase family 4 protein [Bdellovibrionales bacterium]